MRTCQSFILGMVVGVGAASAPEAHAGPPVSSSVPDTSELREPGSAQPVQSLSRLGVAAKANDPLHRARTDPLTTLPFSVVELPTGPVPGPPARRHHALSMRFETAEHAMRSWGMDVSDCSLQLRMPSKMAQARSGASIDVMAQVRVGCRF